MLATGRRLEELDPTELRQALADENDAFRQMLAHEQRSLTPTILAALAIAGGSIVCTIGILFLFNTYFH